MWTIGREREKLHAAKFVRAPDQQALLFPVIDAVHDLKEGVGDTSGFVAVAEKAMMSGDSGVWQNTANWLRKVGNQWPSALDIWDRLAASPDWKVRWRVACCLYHDIPEPQSNRLFSRLRDDRSKKVREYAVSRYEYRPDSGGQIEKRHDASEFRGG